MLEGEGGARLARSSACARVVSIGVMPSVGGDFGRRVCRVRCGDQQWVGLGPLSGAVAGQGLALSVLGSPPAGNS